MLTERAPSAPPHGLDAIVATFGDPRPLVGRDGAIAPTWEVQRITRVRLPRPMRYAHGEVSRVAVHKALARPVKELFEELDDVGLWDEIAELGAVYEPRPLLLGDGLSTHTWGIAIDLVARAATMPEAIVRTLAHYGFSWGGPLAPDHFQFATGYELLPGSAAISSVAWIPEPLPHEPTFRAV